MCVQVGVQVCGPRSAEPLLAVAAADRQTATTRLAASSLPLPRHYAVARGDTARNLQAGQTLPELDSSQLITGHLPVESLAATMAMPRMCPGFYSDQQAPALLDRVRVVSAWINQALVSKATPGRAPDRVRDAYQALSTCEEGG